MISTEWHDVTTSEPCEICGHGAWCSRNGTRLVCRRQADHPTLGTGVERTDKSGATYWLFTRPGCERRTWTPQPTCEPTPVRADADTLNRVYSAMLAATPWPTEATRELQRRGLTAQQIGECRTRRRYGWLPERGRAAIVRQVIEAVGEPVLCGVPGFVVRDRDGRRYWTLSGRAGLLVPVRDVEGRIIAVTVRVAGDVKGGRYQALSSRKAGGAGPGAPTHVPLWTGERETVRVTEGVLKADVATLVSGVQTIGLQGVGRWKLAADVVQALGASRVMVAFDADWRDKPQVARALESLLHDLRANGLTVLVETWDADAGKGVDDVLLSGGAVETTHPAAVLATLAGPGGTDGPAEAADDPHRLARLCLQSLPPLRYWRGDFYEWDSPAYRLVPPDDLRADVTGLVKAEFDRLATLAAELADPESAKGPPAARKVTKALVSEVLDKLAALTIVSHRQTMPAWLRDAPEWPATECLVTTSGILPVRSLNSEPVLIDPTPDLFTVNHLPFGFDPAATCPQWLAFLAELWPDDGQSIETLQEVFGYLLLPETRLQKMFMLIGPKRSGKGTIARVIKAVVGPENVCAPTLGSLAGEFGLQPLLGKTVGIIGDARLSGRQDSGVIVERLLSVTGEDLQTVNRKHQAQVTDTLPVRFLLLSNELPKLDDASATLPSRMILLSLDQSFYGREDHGLTDRLLTEAPGILNWALRGWQRLHQRGRFVQPDRSRELMDDLETLSSPVTAFIRDRCIVQPEAQEEVRVVYRAWSDWCESKGRRAGSEQTFGRDLRAAVPSVRVTQPRVDGRQVRHYEGLRLGW